jgi:hypothetical protein
MTSKGIWVDDPPVLVKTPAFWRAFQEHGLTFGALMIESSANGLDLNYTPETLAALAAIAADYGVTLVLTVWPEPTKAYLTLLNSKISLLLAAARAIRLECDLESNWTTKNLQGYPSLDAAGDALVAILDRVRANYGPETVVTTFPLHVENSSRADVTTHVSIAMPQGYSVRMRATGEVAWDAPLGPGNAQKLTLDLTKQIKGPRLGCGLAAYDQNWPGHTPDQAMQVAYDTAMTYEPVTVCWWSSKWILGVKANGYSSRFLKSIR